LQRKQKAYARKNIPFNIRGCVVGIYNDMLLLSSSKVRSHHVNVTRLPLLSIYSYYAAKQNAGTIRWIFFKAVSGRNLFIV
jgi:hypothetical protein